MANSSDCLQMGSICSKSSLQEGGHTLLGSGPTNPAAPERPNPAPSDPRTAAAQAAERRMQAVSICHHEWPRTFRICLQAQKRGTNEANPKAGKLSGQLAKQNSTRPTPQAQQEERLVVSDGSANMSPASRNSCEMLLFSGIKQLPVSTDT